MKNRPKSTVVRAAIYARVSSEQQAQQSTIVSQIAALRERVHADGLSLEDDLCFLDDGFSGSTLVRPGLERLRDVAWAGGFTRLYVHSPDRLARKYAWQVLVVEELQRCGVEINFLNRTIGVSPEEDLLLQMQGMIAEYERAKIMERSRRGKRHAARCGSVNVLCGAPYGYRYITKHVGGGQAQYQVVLEEARLVRQIFEWVGRDRLSLHEVGRRLRRQGIPSAKGKIWHVFTIRKLLTNPAYKGEAIFGKTRVGERRPRLRPSRGHPEQPRNHTRVIQERSRTRFQFTCRHWSVRSCSRLPPSSWLRTAGTIVRKPKALAICCRACWYAAAAATVGTARGSHVSLRTIKPLTPITAASAWMHFAPAEPRSVRTGPFVSIGSMQVSGPTCVNCCKTRRRCAKSSNAALAATKNRPSTWR